MARNTGNVNSQTLDELKKLYEQCDGQMALSSQVLYVMRLQNEMEKMSEQLFHSYENQIFERAMTIFRRHFTEQVKKVLNMESDLDLHGCELVTRRHAYIKDIQEAVAKMVEIFQSIVGSIKNVEQPIFPVLTESLYVFNASLKIISAYSQALNNMADILGDGKNYAFLLYPAMIDIIYTDVLFTKRDKAGKVIIVTFPERLAEDPGVIPILFHEAFHVVCRDVRCRKLRARCFFENILSQLHAAIFNVTLTDSNGHAVDEEKRTAFESKWIDNWFGKATTVFLQELDHLDDVEERRLYAQNLTSEIKKHFYPPLRGLSDKLYSDVSQDLIELLAHEEISDYEQYCKAMEGFSKNLTQIKANVEWILFSDLLEDAADTYMYIYREGYADIASCLFLELDADQYDAAFDLSCQFTISKSEYVDIERVVRQYLVCKTLAEISENCRSWETKAQECMEKIKSRQDIGKEKNINFLGNENKVNDMENGGKVTVLLNDTVLASFACYFKYVAKNLQDHFTALKEIPLFRSYIKKIISWDDEVMENVCLGNIPMFREI